MTINFREVEKVAYQISGLGDTVTLVAAMMYCHALLCCAAEDTIVKALQRAEKDHEAEKQLIKQIFGKARYSDAG